MPISKTPVLESERLYYYLPHEKCAAKTLAYYQENAAYLAPFSPLYPPGFYTLPEQKRLMRWQRQEAKAGRRYTFWLEKRDHPGEIIGFVSLNDIVYGTFRSCHMGYSLSAANQRRGLMTEAVTTATDFAFDGLLLHRVQISILPENTPSLRVAEKAGYQREGHSPAYLAIAGAWKDHIHMVRLNENIPPPA